MAGDPAPESDQHAAIGGSQMTSGMISSLRGGVGALWAKLLKASVNLLIDRSSLFISTAGWYHPAVAFYGAFYVRILPYFHDLFGF